MAEPPEKLPQVASPATREALEFPSLLALHAELAASDLGRRRLLELQPSSSAEAIDRRQRRAREARRLLESGPLVASQEEPLTPLIEGLRARERGVTGAQLRQLAGVLETTRRAAERAAGIGEGAVELSSLLAACADAEPLRRSIVSRLDERGRVRDDASPMLVDLRRRVQRIRDELYGRLHDTLGRHREHFSEDTVSLRDGRLTLLLQAGARGRVDGLVHGHSGSGRSLYFEPLNAVEANNDLQEALEQEEAERQRILTELVEEARCQLPLVEAHLDALAEMDALQSICRFADRCEAILPEISERGEILLLAARHPLLDPSLAPLREAALGQAGHTAAVVPLELGLEADRRILVVTGPNAGGKTVALKTLGLLTLAAQCGLPIPVAAGTRIGSFARIMAMVGDEQDLLTDRSTFSARLLRLKEAWEVAGPRSLVLLDELGSGTDPEEGAALAVALLEDLLEGATLAMITTHLTQLAAVALERPGAACAAMEFDAESGEPTFRLRPGAPGGSQALALARRLGLPRRWLERAESLLGREHRQLRTLLREVEAVRGELAASRDQARSEARELEQQRRRLDEELAAAKEERRRLGPKLKSELEAFKRTVRSRLGDELEAMRDELARGRRKKVVPTAVERLFEDAPEVEPEVAATGEPPEVGDRVRHRALGWRGRLAGVRGQTAEVVVQGKRLRCALEDLSAVGENAAGKPRWAPPVRVRRSSSSEDDFPRELHLRGQRVEPALEAMDRYLDQALLSGLAEVRIVHGHGSGRLRAAVREHLKPHPAVADFRPGRSDEGADGATIVILSKS